jgi:archaellum component FlaF (FlaF/FlaG flagellin family)
MESGIPALFIAAILMFATVLVGRGGFIGMDNVGQSLKVSEVRNLERIGTELVVTGTAIDGTGANVTVTVRNDGQTLIGDFSRMDVLVQYFDESAVRHDKWIAHVIPGALASDTWTTGVFTSDVFEPGILNPGETMEILVRVNPVVGAGTTNKVVIASEQGVTTQALFAGPP